MAHKLIMIPEEELAVIMDILAYQRLSTRDIQTGNEHGDTAESLA